MLLFLGKKNFNFNFRLKLQLSALQKRKDCGRRKKLVLLTIQGRLFLHLMEKRIGSKAFRH